MDRCATVTWIVAFPTERISVRPTYSPLTIVTWFVATAMTVLLFGVAIANCAHTVHLAATVDINEGDPFPLDGPHTVRIHLRASGLPAERCDAFNGTYQPSTNTCLVHLFP